MQLTEAGFGTTEPTVKMENILPSGPETPEQRQEAYARALVYVKQVLGEESTLELENMRWVCDYCNGFRLKVELVNRKCDAAKCGLHYDCCPLCDYTQGCPFCLEMTRTPIRVRDALNEEGLALTREVSAELY